ncbi:MAG: dockerin type I domain-containing protein [Candidatus Daviesbacteria bacterium]|nr:dockerin type I domain-containing protein [Candidatus Daviesbacteria bacterium]
MTNFFNKFKIPTLLGLSIIILGIISGLYLVLREQVFLSQAAPDLTPRDVAITNITDDSAVISWQTNTATKSFITYGQKNPGEQTVLDDRDANPTPSGARPKPRLIHYVTLKNLLPNTNYLFKITSGKFISEVMKFDTANPLINQAGFTPVIGSVIDGNNPLNDGVVYLSIQDAATQSSLIKSGGNFLIPIAQIRKTDLSDVFPLTEETIAKLTINSDKGNASILFKLQTNSSSLPPVKLGQDLDLTILTETPLPSAIKDLDKYDLNSDGKINSTDYAILSSCFGKQPNTALPGNRSCAKTDINTDGVINQKDLDLMSQKLKSLGSQ